MNENLRKVAVRKDFYHAGTYLGKTKNGRFFPSLDLLAIIAKGKSNKILVDKKASWLFICGRDILRKGIVSTQGQISGGKYALVLNEYDECLGFGRITQKSDPESTEAFVRNISDIGDFLRRES